MCHESSVGRWSDKCPSRSRRRWAAFHQHNTIVKRSPIVYNKKAGVKIMEKLSRFARTSQDSSLGRCQSRSVLLLRTSPIWYNGKIKVYQRIFTNQRRTMICDNLRVSHQRKSEIWNVVTGLRPARAGGVHWCAATEGEAGLDHQLCQH